jgi:hypothetical protein
MTLNAEHEDAYRAELRAFRAQLSAYYEKLALLDGGTVALVITAVLGPLHDKVKHKYFLASGLSILVVALLVLLYRNLMAVEYERASTATWFRQGGSSPARPDYLEVLLMRRQVMEVIGASLTAIGMVILLVNVWLVL